MGGLRSCVMVGVAVLALSGCAKAVQELRHFPEIFNPPVNLTEYNYAAADYLVGQARNDLSLSDPISIGVLHPANLTSDEKTPPFGKITADQIGTRLVQLGYNVRDLGVGATEGANLTEGDWIDLAKDNGSANLITGTYTISEYDILINLRVLNVKSGRILGASDYRIPLGSDTYQMIGRDPYFHLRGKKPVNNPDAELSGSPLASRDLPTRIIPEDRTWEK